MRSVRSGRVINTTGGVGVSRFCAFTVARRVARPGREGDVYSQKGATEGLSVVLVNPVPVPRAERANLTLRIVRVTRARARVTPGVGKYWSELAR